MTEEERALMEKLADAWDAGRQSAIDDTYDYTEFRARSNPHREPTEAEAEEVRREIIEAQSLAAFKERVETSSLGTPRAKAARDSISPAAAVAVMRRAEALIEQQRLINLGAQPETLEILAHLDESVNPLHTTHPRASNGICITCRARPGQMHIETPDAP